MKQTIILICVVLTFLKINTTYGWDTTAAKFYPLSVGNYYVFERFSISFFCTYYQFSGFHTVEITSDTILSNSKKYYKFENWWPGEQWMYQRIDSNSMNVYSYNTFTFEEELLDSLFANKGNSFLGKRNTFGTAPCIVIDTVSQYTFNNTRLIKYINASGTVSMGYSLIEGIGFTAISSCELGSGVSFSLKGCILNGVLYGDTSLTSFKTISNETPPEYKLYQNFPNPFNPSTSIKYDIQKSGNVILKVYNISGKEVTTLVDQYQNAGSYIIHFDSKRMASGVYYYRIQSGDFMDVKKFVLIK